jgi:hypothetical protein
MKPALLFTLFAFGFIAMERCSAQREDATNKRDAEAVVVNLYKQVVLRRPLGIPMGADRQAISPFLSRGLIRRLNAAQTCANDYYRQHNGDNGKPEFAWLEMGLFSGGNEEAIPSDANVQRTDIQQDGSYRVRVQLTHRESFETYGRAPDPANTFKWSVVVAVIRDGSRFAVDDVLYLDEDSKRIESRMSQFVSLGCEMGRHKSQLVKNRHSTH